MSLPQVRSSNVRHDLRSLHFGRDDKRGSPYDDFDDLTNGKGVGRIRPGLRSVILSNGPVVLRCGVRMSMGEALREPG